ncbi:glutathione-dependent formaldehyde-activating enzyme [Cercophora newfieldiana]|uniref:Glutathione-dependent formaldehyde-activating enzyme n=1 Tax=Cercophora newfieldiana TaxID=92897 RepID=A0AA40CL17_9PEZI|nr:glutathione-dependent formaldehyde-activating enzyme [Cercophora newfieldiana]
MRLHFFPPSSLRQSSKPSFESTEIAMSEEQQPLKTYRGNCHCGAFVFEFESAEIQSAYQCNCSICYKKGYLFVSAAPGTYRVVKGDESDLTVYTFGAGNWLHKFCPNCATPLMSVENKAEPRRGLNARVIQGLNVRELKYIPINGAAGPPPYEPPTYSGPEPSAKVENAHMYHGSCHCGAVTLALKSPPLDKDYPGKVVDCNCSICGRNAYVWTYPSADQVVIQGTENLGSYVFGTKKAAKKFCKTCGVNMVNLAADLDEEEVAKLDENSKRMFEGIKTMCPLNLRVLNDVNLSDIKDAEMATRGADMGPAYVNP